MSPVRSRGVRDHRQRLRAADTVVLLGLSPVRCARRAVRRSRERVEFGRWLWSYRRRWRPRVLAAVRAVAPHAEVHVLRTPGAVRGFLANCRSRGPGWPTTKGET